MSTWSANDESVPKCSCQYAEFTSCLDHQPIVHRMCDGLPNGLTREDAIDVVLAFFALSSGS